MQNLKGHLNTQSFLITSHDIICDELSTRTRLMSILMSLSNSIRKTNVRSVNI